MYITRPGKWKGGNNFINWGSLFGEWYWDLIGTSDSGSIEIGEGGANNI